MGDNQKPFFSTPWYLIRFFMPFVGLLAFAVYAATLFPCVYPGRSAFLMAVAAKLCPSDFLSEPLFLWAAQGVAQIPWGTLPLRLNLFCAVCGAITVSLFYLFTARLVFIFACEDPGGTLAALPPRSPEADDDAEKGTISHFAVNGDGTVAISPSVRTHNRRVAHAAALGGIGAALTLAFCAPFWLVATRFYPYAFDLMLFFLIANLLISYDQRGRQLSLFLGVFLLAACSIESPLLLIALPIGLGFLLRTMLLNEQVTATKVLNVLFVGFFGAMAAGVLLWRAASQCALIAVPAPRPILRAFTTSLAVEIAKWIPSFGWSHAFVLLLVPTAIALFVFVYSFSRRTPVLFLLQLTLTACLVPSLLNLNGSTWGIARLTSRVPVLSYTVIALFTGLMIAVWNLMRETFDETIDDDRDYYEYRDNPIVSRLGSLLCWPLLAIVLSVPFKSFPDIAPVHGQFADAIAERIYRDMGTHDWLVNNHFLRYHLMIRALRDGRSLHFVWTQSSPGDEGRENPESLAEYIEQDPSFASSRYRLLNAADLSSASFVREWLSSETNAYQRLVLFDSPDLWRNNGYRAVPSGFFLTGQSTNTALDARELLAQHREFLESVRKDLYPNRPDNIRQFANIRLALRRQLAFIANEIAVLLAQQKHPQEAADLLVQTESLCSDNLCILLNRYHLAINTGVRADSASAIETLLNDAARRCDTFKLNAASLQETSGTLINPDILDIVRKTVWSKNSAYRSLAVAARPLHADPLAMLRDKKRALYQAISASINAYAFDDAERQLNLLLDIDDKDPFALVNKTRVALERHDLPEAGLWLDLAKENGVPPKELAWHEAAFLIQSGKTADAKTLLNATLSTASANIELWGLLAEILIKTGAYPELENRVYPSLRGAASRKEHYLLYMVRGYIYKHNGRRDYSAARAAFLRALDLNPNLATVHEEILGIDDALDVPAFSEQDAKEVLRKDPNHAVANYLLGMVRLHRGEIEKADDLFRRSLEKTRNAPAYAGLGAVMLAKNDTVSAEKLLRRSLELDASRAFTWHALARTLLAEGRFDEADKALIPVIKELPNDPDVLLTLIRLRIGQKKTDEAAAKVSDLLQDEESLPPPIARQLHALAQQLSTELSNRP